MNRRPYSTPQVGWTCSVCRSESSGSPIRMKDLGTVCRMCAAFLLRAEESFDSQPAASRSA